MIRIYDDIEIKHEILYSPSDGPSDLDTCSLGEHRAWCHVQKCYHYLDWAGGHRP